MKSPTFRANILMLLTAMIWGSTFLGQNVAMRYMGTFTFSGSRFFLGTLALLPVLIFYKKKTHLKSSHLFSSKTIAGGFLLGVILTIGINLQQIGIEYTTVTNSGFITGLYVIVVPILGLFIGQKTNTGTWIGALLAVLGMGLLTLNHQLTISFGDFITLISAIAWGVHVLLVGIFVTRCDPIAIAFIQCLVCCILSTLLAIPLEGLAIHFSEQALLSILFTGIISVGISFTLQLIAQKDAIASHAAIILSLESVFAAICGALFLGEALTVKGYVGCSLMFIGMLIAQLWPQRTPSNSTII